MRRSVGAHDGEPLEARRRVTSPDLSTMQAKLAEKRAREAAAAPPVPEKLQAREQDADLIPEEDSGYERPEEELTIDGIIDRIGVDEAYDRWIGKKRPQQRAGKREGVMISCPMPNHPDRNPSAWMNLDKKTWFCPGCDLGGDVIDLAAIHFGMSDYKSGKNFGEIRKAIAQDYGYTFLPVPGQREPALIPPPLSEETSPEPAEGADHGAADAPADVAAPAVPLPTPVAAPATVPALPAPTTGPSLSVISSLPEPETDDDDDDIQLPTLDWRELVTPDTFLDRYMQQCIIDDAPEEYHFWNGLVAISMAIGRDVQLNDLKPVLGNLFLCVLGKTGTGKSRAMSHVKNLVDMALPYDTKDPMSRGAKKLATPGSAEVLINQFAQPIFDPSNPKIIMGYSQVRGIVEYSELSSLVGRGQRQGSVLKPTLMQFFDGEKLITTSSLTHGSLRAENAFASLITSTQPKALKNLLDKSDADSGFLNRWIFVTGTPKPQVAIGGAAVDVFPAVPSLQAIHEWANDPRLMGWSPEAVEEFTRFFHAAIVPTKEADDSDMLTRVDLLCKKLCLLLSANEMLEEVSEAVVEKVEKIFEYLVKVFGASSEHLSSTQSREIEEKILSVIKRYAEKHSKADACPQRDIVRAFNAKKYDRSHVLRALEVLVKLQMIQTYQPPAKPGRPSSTQYRVVGE